MKLLVRHAIIVASCVLLGACAGSNIKRGPGVSLVTSNEMPVPVRADLMASEQPYYVGPFDELKIDVYGIEELSNRDVQVDASGRIGFPLVGAIEASGKTPKEIAQEIGSGLRQHAFRNPQVTVNLRKTVSSTVTVEGEVKEPGSYAMIGRTSLLRAIATAKGTTEFSKLDDVVVLRTVQGQKYAALYNLKAIRTGAYPDPDIYPNDIVMVSDARGRRIFKDILQIVPLLTYPLVATLQN